MSWEWTPAKMTVRRIPLVVVVAMLLAAAQATTSAAELAPMPCAPGSPIKLAPAVGIYHGAFPFFAKGSRNEDYVTADRLKRFERLAGKRLAWAYLSNHWFDGIHFPTRAAKTVWEHGAVPFIRMMPWHRQVQDDPDAGYRLQDIVDGVYDDQLTTWADDAKTTEIPLLVEFGTEVNGDWFPWNGRWQGGDETTGYGDPTEPDGPERFRDAYRHIVSLVRAQGANNITWFFHADANSVPETPWNRIAAYYPGDSFIDWLGVSAYGPQAPGDQRTGFAQQLKQAYDQLASLSPKKPLAVVEFGAAETATRGWKARWIVRAFRAVRSGRFPRIHAVAWWDERWQNDDRSISDLSLASSRSARNAYRRSIASRIFTSRPQFECGWLGL